jgi:manganese/zinc/iron transport system ATP- binding protein
MSTTEAVLEVHELTVNYEKTAVLWDVGFSIPACKLVGIVGPNGAGKSTLLKALLGLVPPLSGTVKFFGKPASQVRHQIAYVPQRSSVDWDFPITAFDLVLMGRYGKLGVFKWASKKDKAAAWEALKAVEMEKFAERQISQLSGGQQQRLFIARALLQEASIYLMDEPFASIDVATEKTLIKLFHHLKSQGKTLLVVHHDLSTAAKYFDWMLMLNTCLIASGPTSLVFHKDNILRTYGQSPALIDEAAKLVKDKTTGLV